MDINRFELRLAQIDRPEWRGSRAISLFAATVAIADSGLIGQATKLARKLAVDRQQLYEVTLQSYLFLGFPRMLIAAGQLDSNWPPNEGAVRQTQAISPAEAEAWFENGLALCKKIYGSSFEPLRERVERIAPEVFRWMIIEGYGKVLSRPGLSLIDRELSIVVSLVIDHRPDQLHSHLRGALNAGASEELVKVVLDDLGELTGPGYLTGCRLLEQIGASQ